MQIALLEEVGQSSRMFALRSRKAVKWARNALRIEINKRFPRLPVKKFNQAWHVIGGRRIYFRSRWEANYAFYLEWQKNQNMILAWEHEPKTFWFEGIRRGCVSYLPDFLVTQIDGSKQWIEVKGFMDGKSLTKIRRFKQYFPEEVFLLVDAKWYKANGKILSKLIPGWH